MIDSYQVADTFFLDEPPARAVVVSTTRRGGTTSLSTRGSCPLQTLVKWRDQLDSGLWPAGIRQPDLAAIRSPTCVPSPYSARVGAMHILNALIKEIQ